jgi:hypothetical protein
MVKKPDDQPDQKEIEKRAKEVSELMKKFDECKKQLKDAAVHTKELDKLVG